MSKSRIFPLALSLALVLLAPAASFAAGFTLFGSYWDTDQLGDTAGAGIVFGIPVGGNFDLDLRASYYEELEDQSFDAFLDDVFDDDRNPLVANSLEVTPLEIGLKYNFNPGEVVNFYLGGGGGYYLLDNSRFDVDDEFGYYAVVGFTAGDPDGTAFVLEGVYRKVEGSVVNDPSSLDDVDDLDFNNAVDVDLDGIALNAGVIFRF